MALASDEGLLEASQPGGGYHVARQSTDDSSGLSSSYRHKCHQRGNFMTSSNLNHLPKVLSPNPINISIWHLSNSHMNFWGTHSDHRNPL